MHFNPYGGSAALVAEELVNLGDAPASALLETMRAREMVFTHLTPAEASEIVAWGGRLRAVFHESDVDARVDLVNALLADSACVPYISRHDGKAPHLHYTWEDGNVVRRVRAYTAGGLAHLLCEDPERIGHCGRDGCGTVFVDTSRNGRRRYCSARCATRVHVAEHRDRQRA